MSNDLSPLWQANELPAINNSPNPTAMLSSVKQLRQPELMQVKKAFEGGLYILATEFIWGRSLSVLKAQLGKLSMKLVAEILGRPDILDTSDPELVLTDLEAVSVAHQLGMLSDKGALDLRQSLEQLSHYANPSNNDSELDNIEALRILRSCVVHVLAFDTMSVAVDFTKIRQNLRRQVLNPTADEFAQLANAPYFFKRVVLRTLLADAELVEPPFQVTVLQNLVSLGESFWTELLDAERWTIGQTYSMWAANNLKKHTTYLRLLLLSVKGFDYVPENLRSNTYTEAAANVLRVHEAANNYYNEPAALKGLLDLGNSIPGPATALTMRAILSCWLGNRYGHTFAVDSMCKQAFQSMSPSFWSLYMSRILPGDDYLLQKLLSDKPLDRWRELVREQELSEISAGTLDFLVSSDLLSERRSPEVRERIKRQLKSLRQKV